MKEITSEDQIRAWLLDGTQLNVNGHQASGQVNGHPGHQARPVRSTWRREPQDRSGTWLLYAGLALALLVLAAAAVSYQAQYAMVFAYKNQKVVSAIQAGIPDIGSLVFACLGIALALQGKRALRARALNVACVGISIAMNALGATPGWSALSVWIMAPTIYALASDTLIGVIRAYAIARQKRLDVALADEGVTPLQVVGTVLLYVLRASVALPSTLAGLRRWLLLETPLPERPPVKVIAVKRPKALPRGGKGPRAGTKTSQFLDRVIQKYGPLAGIDPRQVSPISTELAPQVDLDLAAARGALGKAVRAAQNRNTEGEQS